MQNNNVYIFEKLYTYIKVIYIKVTINVLPTIQTRPPICYELTIGVRLVLN